MKHYQSPLLTLLEMPKEDVLALSTLGFDEENKEGVAPGYDVSGLY